MSPSDTLYWAVIVVNVICAAWNITSVLRLRRVQEDIVKERAELLVKVNAALAMPRSVDQQANSMRPFFRPPDGQASNSGTTIRARGDSFG
jgi:uncharacterized protein YfaP (DUF2135 family)